MARLLFLLLPLLSTLGSIAGCSPSTESPLGPDPRQPTVSLAEAKALLAERKWDEAADALRPYASDPAVSSEVLQMYARALVGGKRHSLAVWPLHRLVEREDKSPVADERYVAALLQGGAELEAVAYATEVIERDPENMRLIELRSNAHEQVMDYEAALADMEIVAAENPNRARIIERVLNLLIKVEDWDGARERIDELRELLSAESVKPETRAVFCATSAQFEADRGNYEEAEKQVDACLAEAPAEANLVFTRVELLDEHGRFDEATAYMEQLIEEYPGRQRIRDGLANRYAKLGRYEEADALLFETAELVENISSWLSLANLRASINDLEGTVEALDRGLKVTLGALPEDPGFDWKRLTPDSRFGIGDIYVRAKRWDRAKGVIESLDDEPSMALLLEARMKLDQGDPAGALADYEEAFKTFPSNPAARYLAGRAAIETNDFDKAVSYYQDALRSDAAATDAGLVLGQMLLAEGRVNYAIDMLGFYLTGNENEPHALRLLASTGANLGMLGFAENMRAMLRQDPEWAGVALSDQALDIARSGAPREALAYLEENAVEEEPTLFEAFSAWIAIARQIGREDVKARYAAYQERHAGTVGAEVLAARWAFEDENFEASLAAIDRAIELDPLLPVAHFQRGTTLAKLDRVDEAVAAFDRARELDGADVRNWMASASALIDAERFPEAAERLRELLIHHPWFGRGALALVEMDRDHDVIDDGLAYDYAKRAARYVVSSGPGAHAELGRLHLENGAPDEAVERYTLALNLGHAPSQTVVGLARALEAAERRDDAVEALERFLDEAPEEIDTADARAYLGELAGEKG